MPYFIYILQKMGNKDKKLICPDFPKWFLIIQKSVTYTYTQRDTKGKNSQIPAKVTRQTPKAKIF